VTGVAGVPPVFPRVILIVLDSVGVGELPDASLYGDAGSNTLGNLARAVPLYLPALRSLGLGNVVDIGGQVMPPAAGAFGRLAETSAGKDSVTGHWELMVVVLERAFPTFPQGFPAEVIAEFERRIGCPSIGNVVASGTEIIERLGLEHVRSGYPIVYTSADSVFQIAAHEDIVPVPELYRMCEAAFDIVGRGMGVGRVIARPFTGAPGSFRRTSNRHDYALDPTGETVLDVLVRNATPVISVGKVKDLFAGRGISRSVHSASDAEGMAHLERLLDDEPSGLIFANLVDFDTQYGHRNDPSGYAANLERFDAWLGGFLPRLAADDLLLITADHGNDPTTPSTDHSREYVPILAAGPGVRAGVDLGTRPTFADLGQTLAENFGVTPLTHGRSFLQEIRGEHS
jgi:phosphopentomutase